MSELEKGEMVLDRASFICSKRSRDICIGIKLSLVPKISQNQHPIKVTPELHIGRDQRDQVVCLFPQDTESLATQSKEVTMLVLRAAGTQDLPGDLPSISSF